MSAGKHTGDLPLTLVRGDITLEKVDAFVFYASHDLKLGSGFGGAIAVRGGPSIQEELGGRGPIETCEVVATAAGDLPAGSILHAVGPRFMEEDLEGKLRRTMRNVFLAAAERGLRRIAFPPMGAGFYGIPLDLCARVMVEEIESHLTEGGPVSEVIICVQDSREQKAFEERLSGGGA